MTLAILVSLKTMESLENGLQPNSGVTPLFSMRPVLTLTLSVNGPLEDCNTKPQQTQTLYSLSVLWHFVGMFSE